MFFLSSLADFFSFSHDFKQRGKELVDLEIHPQVQLQLTHIMSNSLAEAFKAMTSVTTSAEVGASSCSGGTRRSKSPVF
jgi:hypothetical protein